MFFHEITRLQLWLCAGCVTICVFPAYVGLPAGGGAMLVFFQLLALSAAQCEVNYRAEHSRLHCVLAA